MPLFLQEIWARIYYLRYVFCLFSAYMTEALKLANIAQSLSRAHIMIEITSMRNYLKDLELRLESIWGYL